MSDALAEAIQKLTARRSTLAREVATLDEAIAALLRVRDAPREASMTVPAAVDDGEDPTDRALRLHKELHPGVASTKGARA